MRFRQHVHGVDRRAPAGAALRRLGLRVDQRHRRDPGGAGGRRVLGRAHGRRRARPTEAAGLAAGWRRCWRRRRRCCAGPLGGWLLPQDLPLDAATAAMVRGSLVATRCCSALPVLVLGATAPLLVSLLARDTCSSAGAGHRQRLRHPRQPARHLRRDPRAGAGHRLPRHHCGCARCCWRRRRCWCAAARRAVAALRAGRRQPVAAAGPLRRRCPGCATAGRAREPLPVPAGGAQRTPAGGERTELKINEGLDSFHSVAIAGSALTGGCYYDYHMLPALLAGDGARPPDLPALSIGDAAGTLPIALCRGASGRDGRRRRDRSGGGAARRRSSSPARARRRGASRHGRPPVRRPARHAGTSSTSTPTRTRPTSRRTWPQCEFFTALRSRLEDGGVVACNVGGLQRRRSGAGGHRPGRWQRCSAAPSRCTCRRRATSCCWRAPAGRCTPRASRASAGPASSCRRTTQRLGGHPRRGAAARGLARVRASCRRGGLLLTDDGRCSTGCCATPTWTPTMQRQSMAISGSVAVGRGRDRGAGSAARRRLCRASCGWRRAAGSASPYLRLLCGDARWQLRQLRAPGQSIRTSLALAPHRRPDAATGATAASRSAKNSRRDSMPAAVARRNSWLAAVTALLLLLLGGAGLLRRCAHRMSSTPAGAVGQGLDRCAVVQASRQRRVPRQQILVADAAERHRRRTRATASAGGRRAAPPAAGRCCGGRRSGRGRRRSRADLGQVAVARRAACSAQFARRHPCRRAGREPSPPAAASPAAAGTAPPRRGCRPPRGGRPSTPARCTGSRRSSSPASFCSSSRRSRSPASRWRPRPSAMASAAWLSGFFTSSRRPAALVDDRAVDFVACDCWAWASSYMPVGQHAERHARPKAAPRRGRRGRVPAAAGRGRGRRRSCPATAWRSCASGIGMLAPGGQQQVDETASSSSAASTGIRQLAERQRQGLRQMHIAAAVRLLAQVRREQPP